MKSASLLILFWALFALPLMGYPPAPKFDHRFSIHVFGKELMIRHYEGIRGWNSSQSDGAHVGVIIGTKILIDLRRSTAILCVIGWTGFLAGFTTWRLRKKRAESGALVGRF